MKKFFLVLLFCVFPFQVLAGDVSYWADGQIKRKGVSGKVVAIGMAWNGSGCLVKKAPNREEGGFSVRILRDGAALVWTVSRPGGARRGEAPSKAQRNASGRKGSSSAICVAGVGFASSPVIRLARAAVRQAWGISMPPASRPVTRPVTEIARASDGLQSGNLRFGYVAEEPPAFHKVIDLPFDEQEARGVSVLIGAFDEAWDILIRGQQEPPGVKRVRRLFIGKEGQFPGIGGEQIVGVGVAAHLGDIHETGIGDEHGLRARFFQSHQDAVVPIKVGEQVMKRDAPEPRTG